MKRIREACLMQTLHFQLKDNVPHEEAVRLVDQEVHRYLEQLDKSRTRYRIDEQTRQDDGSVLLRIRRQVMEHPIGAYMD